MTVPWPLTMRVPRKPYTTSASCGPALRYSLANMVIRNRIASTISPAITNTPTEMLHKRLLWQALPALILLSRSAAPVSSSQRRTYAMPFS